jgi:hypothetical protein
MPHGGRRGRALRAARDPPRLRAAAPLETSHVPQGVEIVADRPQRARERALRLARIPGLGMDLRREAKRRHAAAARQAPGGFLGVRERLLGTVPQRPGQSERRRAAPRIETTGEAGVPFGARGVAGRQPQPRGFGPIVSSFGAAKRVTAHVAEVSD